MGFYWEGLGFGVEMGSRGHFNVTCGDAEGGVLDCLESIEGSGRGVGEPDGCSVGE